MQFQWDRLHPPTTRRFVAYTLYMHILISTIGCGVAYILINSFSHIAFGASVVIVNFATMFWMSHAMRDVVVDEDLIRKTITGRRRIFLAGVIGSIVIVILLALWISFEPPSWQSILLLNMFFGLWTGNLTMLRNVHDGYGAVL